MQQRITDKTRTAWCFAAASAPVALICTKFGWLWVLAGSAAAAGVNFLGYCLQKKNSGTLEKESAVGYKAVFLFQILWGIFVGGKICRLSLSAFPDDHVPEFVTMLILAALAAFAGRKGETAAARAAGTAGGLLGMLYLAIGLAAASKIRLAWCKPAGTWIQGLIVFGMLLFPNIVTLNGQKTGKPQIWLYLIPPAVSLITAGFLSPQLAAHEPLPLYTVVKSLRVFSSMERFESVLSMAMWLGLFSALSLAVLSVSRKMNGILNLNEKAASCIAAAAMLAVNEMADALTWEFWVVGAGVFWGVLPLLTQHLVDDKKVENFDKKGLTKGKTADIMAEFAEESEAF